MHFSSKECCERMMDSLLGDIDLNRIEFDSFDDTQLHVQICDDTNGLDVNQQKGGEETVITTAQTQPVEQKGLEQPEKEFEEPEEGEISDDEHGLRENEDVPQSSEKEVVNLEAKEPSLSVEKSAMASFSRWPARANGDERQGGWKLHSEASGYSGQPDRFYQFAWAKGVQGSPKDTVGHSFQEGRSGRTADSSNGSPLTLCRSGSADRKGGWIVGDRGIEYVSFMTSDDGYLYLQEGGDWSELRRGESWRGRSDRESAERTSMSAKYDDKYRNQLDDIKDHRRRLESGRSSRERKRENWDEGNLEEVEMEGEKARVADRGSGEHNRHGKGRDWVSRKSESSNLKGRGDLNTLSESLKDKLFAQITDYLRNVSVRDAQKSFLEVCRQLRRGLRALKDLNENLMRAQGKHIESQRRKLLALTRDAFSGIRAAYAVRNTAIGKEQEQDTDTFPSLLELAQSRCYNLFTSKQLQELESMMQTIGCQNRTEALPKPYERGGASNKSARGEEKDLRVGESSGNTSATTQLESESITDASGKGRTLDLGDEAEQPLNPSCQRHASDVLVDQPVNEVDNSAAGSLGFGGWFSSNPEQDMKETESIFSPSLESSLDLNDDQSKSQLQGINVYSRRDTLGGNYKKDTLIFSKKDLRLVSQLDPVKALTSYHEKFAGKSQSASAQLPSPTPSEEDDTTVNSVIVNLSSAANLDSREPPATDKQASGLPQGTQVSLFGSIMRPVSAVSPLQDQNFPAKDNHGSHTLPELSLFPSLESSLVDEGSSEGLQRKVILSNGQKKSRDPRRRLANQELNLGVSQSDKHGIEGSDARSLWSVGPTILLTDLKRSRQQSPQTSQGSLLLNGELVPLLTLASGGWPEVTANVPGDMVVGDAGSRASWDSTGHHDERSQKKRQVEVLIEEASSKRHKFASATFMEDDEVPLLKATAELQAGFVGAVGADIKRGVLDVSSTLQGVTSSRQSASVSESTVHDVSKRQMKPRDPRRVLLEASKAISTPAITPSASKATNSGCGEARGALPPPVLTHNFPGKLACSANTMTMRPNPVAKTGSGLVQDSQSNGNNKPNEPPSAIKSTGMEMKVPMSKLMGTLDLNLSAAANLKQGEIMNHWDQLEPLLEGLDEKQKQAVRRERARRIEEQSRMFVAKKLCLVLDLDHTLLNSAKFTEIESEWEAKLQANELAECQKFGEEGSHRRELYRFQHMGMWTKLRPGIWNFLARASHLYELHVYTMGNKAYATEMAKLLDPTGKLFAGRVISKGDDSDIVEGDERLSKSKDLEGVLGMESAVVIIDDSARVWPHHRHNLIVVERYMYFPCTRKQFGLPGPSLLEVGHDEREQDGMLASALMVIEKIHYSFFSNSRLHEVDVRDILADEQRRVLAGCKLIFSRVFPQGEVQPHLHPLWQLAEQFGAMCSMTIDEGVTHVVAISLGTEKVNWAMSTGRFVVRPSWVEASAILYRRANERDFSVTLLT